MKIAFVVSEFNSEVTTPMEQRARRHAESLGVEVARVVQVPGVYDMAPVVKALLQRKEIDGVVMIGAVIKGETNHDEVIAHAIARAGIELALEFDKPVGLSIIGPAHDRRAGRRANREREKRRRTPSSASLARSRKFAASSPSAPQVLRNRAAPR